MQMIVVLVMTDFLRALKTEDMVTDVSWLHCKYITLTITTANKQMSAMTLESARPITTHEAGK